MKLKNIVALVLALAVSVCCLGVSAFAVSTNVSPADLWGLTSDPIYVGKSGSSDLDPDKLAMGSLSRVKVGNDIIECYTPAVYTKDYYNSYHICVEKVGFFNHLWSGDSGTDKFGAWELKYFRDDSSSYHIDIYKSGSYFCGISKGYSKTTTYSYVRYGFSLVTVNGKQYIWFVYIDDLDYELANIRNNSSWYYSSALVYNPTDYKLPAIHNWYLLDPTEGGNTVSTEVDIPGGDSLSDAYMKSKLTCPNCGGHNISYRWSFLQSGVVGVVTWQVGYVFKCRDCSASWRAMFDSDENDKFKDYIATGDDSFTPDQIQEDLTLPAFTSSSDWGVTLPDDSDTAGYLNEVFGALNTYTGAFNSFFSQVFSILPAPVLAVILLGVGLVVIVGIIKAVVG